MTAVKDQILNYKHPLTCPIAAAVMVARPNVTPRVVSIRSPTCIMIMLSIMPKPTIGTATCVA